MTDPTELVCNVLEYYSTVLIERGEVTGPMFPDITNYEKAEAIVQELRKAGLL